MRILSFVAALFVVLGCGSGDEKLSPLSADQKQRFNETITDLARSLSAPSKVSSKKTKGISPSFSSLLGMVQGHYSIRVHSALDTKTDKSLAEMAKRLQEAFEKGDCKEVDESGKKVWNIGIVEIPKKDRLAGKSVEIPKVKFSIVGDKCPIELSVSSQINLDGKGNKMEGDLNLQYSVKDEDFRKLNDVDSVKLGAQFNLNMETTDSSARMDGKANLEGNLHSQKHGNIAPYVKVKAEGKMERDPKMSSGSSEAKLGLRYSDFTAEYKVTQNQVAGQEPEIKYFVNNEEISKKEFEDELGKLEVKFGDNSSTHKIDLNK